MVLKDTGKSIFKTLIIGGVIFAILFAGLWLLLLSRDVNRPGAIEKACYANMRIILGAVEMYNMDHTKKMTELNQANLELLTESRRYLRKIPQKPEKGCDYSSEGVLNDKGNIVCAVHGTVEGPPAPKRTILDEILSLFK